MPHRGPAIPRRRTSADRERRSSRGRCQLRARGRAHKESRDGMTRLGGWLFKHRTALPVPIVLALLLLPPTSSSTALRVLGIVFVASGEVLRLLAVRHIGAVSRTRTDRLGPLVASGPFRWVRNPLYIGNLALWVGLTLTARLPWLVVPVALLLALEYHAIVRWEEALLEARLGDSTEGMSRRCRDGFLGHRQPHAARRAGALRLARDAVQRTRDVDRARRWTGVAVGEDVAPNLRLSQRYQHATERYGRHASPIFVSRSGFGR